MVAPAIIAAGITAAASLGGGFMSAMGASNANAQNAALNYQALQMQSQENQMNRAMQDRVNAENFASSDRANQNAWAFADQQNRVGQAFAREQMFANMDFQERMSSSAYQRAVQDMRAAGLNPMLAYIQGGSSSPAGGTPGPSAAGGSSQAGSGSGFSSDAGKPSFSMQNTEAELGRAIGKIGSSAVDAYKNTEAARLIKDQQKLTQQQEVVGAAQATNLHYDSENKKMQHGQIQAQTGVYDATKQLVNAQTAKTLNEAVEAGANAQSAIEHGGRHTPNSVERLLRMLQGTVSEDLGKIQVRPKEW